MQSVSPLALPRLVSAAETATPPPPTIGRIVHYVMPDGRNPGRHRPAVIVEAWDSSKANLQVLTDGTNDYSPEHIGSAGIIWRTSVPYSEDTTICGTWHWPERA